ncbi:MAG: mechanosensitive ion channel domain-containing protein [Bacteroides sp.]|jgi:small conductance mechanosensitive channel|nr:mechanosensitive ion channel domain-containing protein [Bacteroides sp.]
MENLGLEGGNLSNIMEMINSFLVTYGLKLIGAIAALIIGFWLIKKFSKFLQKTFEKREMEASLASFLRTFITIALKVLVVISILGMVGIQMTSFIAIIGAVGLAVGLALSGTLQNFAGGVILLLLKPFKAGDFIEAQGFLGSVQEVQIFNTILNTPDNKRIIIPNGPLSTGPMTNYSALPTRRVDWVFGIGYGDSFPKAKEVLSKLISNDSRILKDPEPAIVLSSLSDSSVDITVRAWVNGADYWAVFFEMQEKVYDVFAKEGINIPFPQMDVHLHQQK